VRVAAGVFAIGFLLFTVLLKIAVPIMLADARRNHGSHPAEPSAVPDFRHAVAETALPS
jgi:hypothetical protein